MTTSTFIAACIQNSATSDVDHNIDVASRLIRQAAKDGATFIATAEYFSGLTTQNGLFMPAAFVEEGHPVLTAFSALAAELECWLLLGSIGVLTADGRINNRSCMIGPDGQLVASYDKIHLFDVDLNGVAYRESATIAAGDQTVIAETPFANIGLSICYDLRFGALYRSLAQQGADILATPAAFTKVTGEAHWHVLQRARAIENGAFVIAPCQYGEIEGGGACYGHSLIVDPWGAVLADGSEGEGVVMAEIDMAKVQEARGRIPSLTHDVDFSM
ncbi:MAG: carbon-nitrogen hydrolase family protein [Hyphomicrobiales bacterium]